MKNKKNAFTLVELMLVITITILLMIGVYAPYNYYSNKAKLKVSKTSVAKTIYEARNMAIYGLNQGVNRSIGVYFDNSISKRNKIFVYSYPYSYSGVKNNFTSSGVELVKDVLLEPSIVIEDISGKDKAIFYFDAISGSGSFYYYDDLGEHSFTSPEINIDISFKNSDLKTDLKYYTKTDIVDY